jgi:tripeptide aminopeptidase
MFKRAYQQRPNIFNGEMAFYGKHEYVIVLDMENASKVLVHLSKLWTVKESL